MLSLTSKELDYVTDSLNNEDLLVKRCLNVAAQTQEPAVQTLCQQLASRHLNNYQTLHDMLSQGNTAANQPQ